MPPAMGTRKGTEHSPEFFTQTFNRVSDILYISCVHTGPMVWDANQPSEGKMHRGITMVSSEDILVNWTPPFLKKVIWYSEVVLFITWIRLTFSLCWKLPFQFFLLFRYISTLYSHPDWPKIKPGDMQEELKNNIDSSLVWLFKPQSLYRYINLILQKRKEGQPISFTDFFGHMVGETLLREVGKP